MNLAPVKDFCIVEEEGGGVVGQQSAVNTDTLVAPRGGIGSFQLKLVESRAKWYGPGGKAACGRHRRRGTHVADYGIPLLVSSVPRLQIGIIRKLNPR